MQSRGGVSTGAASAPAAGFPPPGAAEAEVRRRIAELERAFGDPDDPHNPTGSAAFLAADAREEPLAAAELLVERFGLNDEFVPAELGGR